MTGPLDRALAVAVRRAGAPGRIRYTERQLYYELCRVLLPLHHAPRRPRFTLPAPVGFDRYRAALHRLDPVPGLLPPPAAAPRGPVPAEVFDYGLPRLLVCQDAQIAAMLRANGLHMESACPVFARSDLPLDPRLAAALRRAGDATVYVLHDAGRTGTVDAVRGWASELDVHPIGLRPAHAAALHLTRGRPADGGAAPADPGGGAAPAGPAADDLPGWERRWLESGRTAEVAAVNPARLLRTVHRLVRGRVRGRPRTPRLRRIRGAGYLSWPLAEGTGT